MGASAALRLMLSTDEGTWGTDTATTRKLHGLTDASLSANQTVEVVPTVGNFGPGTVSARTAQSGEGSIEFVATYEELPIIYNGLFTAIDASSITSGSPYNYPYTAPNASTQVVNSYTMEFGTTGQCYQMTGSVFNTLTLKGEAGGLWTGSVDVLGKRVDPATMTTEGVNRGVNPIRMADTSLYVDAFSTGTIGTTLTSGTLISFELSVNPNRHLKTFAGSEAPASWGDGRWEGSLKTVVEFNSSAKALIDEMLGSTGVQLQKQVRLYATEGSSASVRSATVDFAGVVSDPVKFFDDRDGNMTIEVTWQGKYSTGLGNWLGVACQNGTSSTT